MKKIMEVKEIEEYSEEDIKELRFTIANSKTIVSIIKNLVKLGVSEKEASAFVKKLVWEVVNGKK